MHRCQIVFLVRDENSRDAKATKNVLPDKVLDILLDDNGQGFYLDPFSEVVDFYNKELEFPDCYGEGSYYVKPSLSERARSVHWGKLL